MYPHHHKRNQLLVSALMLFAASSAVIAQRSSPQFSFPPPSSIANPFGADVFGSNSQDLQTLAGLSQNGGSQSSSLIAQSGSQQGGLIPLGAQLGGSVDSLGSSGQASQQSPQQVRSSEPLSSSNVQLSRPSLSLSSLNAPSLSSASSPSASSSSPSSSGASSGRQSASLPTSAGQAQTGGSRSSASGQSHQRHHNQQAASHQHSNQQHNNNNNNQHQHQHQTHNSQHHPSNLQTQPTSQSLNAQNNQAAIESARKAEATAASLAASLNGQNYHCPDSFGFFRHHKSCDKYWACENNTAALKLCGNGLMFDDSDPKRENCAYPFSVDCGADRTDLEPPISTPHCPRLYGLFADSANCRVFYSCWNGEASKYECPPGLAYDNEQRVCVWADLVERCDQSEVSDGFVCPDPTEVDQPGHYTRHAHPTDCRKFYVCIEGVARPYGCSFGTVFNVDSLQCDEPENVSGCEKYYGDMDPKLAKKLARENAREREGGLPASRAPASSSASSSSSSSSSSGGAQRS